MNEEETKNHEGAPVTSEASHTKDDALASFNKDFKELQEKYGFKVIGVPHITFDGRIETSVQVLDLSSLPVKEEEEVKE